MAKRRPAAAGSRRCWPTRARRSSPRVYLDGGLEPVRRFLLREFASGIEDARQPDYFGRDYKSRLQEKLQALGRPLPIYRVSAEVGPDHRKLFQVDVIVGEQGIAQGTGRTKKEAEQDAAKMALDRDRRQRMNRQPATGNRQPATGNRHRHPKDRPGCAQAAKPQAVEIRHVSEHQNALQLRTAGDR